MDDPFSTSGSASTVTTSISSNSNMSPSKASTSYTIMSPRAFSSSPLLPDLLQKGSPGTTTSSHTTLQAAANTSHRRQSSLSSSIGQPVTSMTIASPSSIMRPVSPPTPAPSPQPDLGMSTHTEDGLAHGISSVASSSTPAHPSSVIMSHSGSAALGEPGTPVSPGTEDAQGLAWGNPNVHIHPSHFNLQDVGSYVDPQVQAAFFASQFIQYIVDHFPRLNGPERRTLFTSLLPHMTGEDLLHLSELISPYLRRDFLSELPAEIALKILTYIDDPKDLVRASRVSKTWRSLVADEQNWKLMLQKYNGGEWAEARPAPSSKPAAGATSPTSDKDAYNRQLGNQARAQSINTRISNVISPTARTHLPANLSHLPSEHLASIAQASVSRIQEYRPSQYPAQNTFYGIYPGAQDPNSFTHTLPPVASTSAAPGLATRGRTTATAPSEGPEVEDEDVNRFLDENQTPLAERVRRNKGKGRARRQEESAGLARDLSATGFADEGQIPSGASSGTVGLVPLDQNIAQRGSSAGGLHGLGVLPPRAGSIRGNSAFPSQASPSAAAVLASQQLQQSTQQHRWPPSGTVRTPFAPVPFLAPQDLSGHLQRMSLASSTLPIHAPFPNAGSAHPGAFTSSSTVSSAVSPSATFQPAYASPAQPNAHIPSQIPAPSGTLGAPNIIATVHASPIFSRSAPGVLPAQAHSAPQPSRIRVAKSRNPFGTAQTNLSYTAQYQNDTKQSASFSASSKPFSYKTQFKKAYLTESNWLKGPGRVLSRQTCTDDGVVTSLGFDNEWIIVGMATNQIHVFDAKTGAYVQQLVGHSLGVWCLVLVSKGGQRLDKDGKKVRSPDMEGHTIPEVFKQAETPYSGSEDEEETDSDEDGDVQDSPTTGRAGTTHLRAAGMERMRSASARPADRESFFQEASDSLASSPDILGPHQGSPQASEPTPSSFKSRRLSSAAPCRNRTKRRNKRPSSFCGIPSSGPSDSAQDGPSSSSSRSVPRPSGFPFGGEGGNISPQQAAACGTAQGWGQPGAVAVSGGCDRDVRVWDVASGRCIHVLRGHLSTVRCLKVLDGRPIAVSGSRDNTLRVWDIERGVLLHVLSGHQHSVRCIEISGNKVVSGSYDATCKIWDVDTGECLHTLQGHQHQIYAVAFDGNRVASGSLDSTVRIWSAKTGECLALLQGHTSLVGQLQLTDSLLVTGGSDGRVIVFSLSTFECLHRLCAHDNSVTCLQFNDRFMVTGGNDGRVKLWDRPTGKLIRDLAEPCEAVWRVTFREDKFVLLCKRGNRTIMEVRTFAPFEEEL
ncbi:hypothetical protein P389DRAFT_174789 [Cystobasidium minutum MCA 4210]|uniref:uncharacterized protein n=1 Tax=Cystobasidium minutum MCA 4210 TaxID=1397322 RepID=UPI0034CFB565|eukprot:jgi/Rhomi1/174789/fgenesh1_kg.8_\